MGAIGRRRENSKRRVVDYRSRVKDRKGSYKEEVGKVTLLIGKILTDILQTFSAQIDTAETVCTALKNESKRYKERM